MTTDLKHQEELDRLRSQVTRLRAALASIRDLCPAEEPRASLRDYDGSIYAVDRARHEALEEASSLAAAALGGGT